MEKYIKEECCIAVCPRCDGNGLLFVEIDKDQQMYICCDECLLDFQTPLEALNNANGWTLRYSAETLKLNGRKATLEEIDAKGWLDYIYTWENNKWLKYTDKTKTLF